MLAPDQKFMPLHIAFGSTYELAEDTTRRLADQARACTEVLQRRTGGAGACRAGRMQRPIPRQMN